MEPGYNDEVEDKASDGGDTVGHVKCECVGGLQTIHIGILSNVNELLVLKDIVGHVKCRWSARFSQM